MGRYVTVEELQNFRPAGSTGVADLSNFTDEDLESIIAETETLVETLTGNIFYPKTSSFRIDGNNGKELFLFSEEPYKILSITSVKKVNFDGSTLATLVENINYIVEPYSLRINDYTTSARDGLNAGVWDVGVRNFAIEGIFGMYHTPGLLKRAIKMLAICNSVGPKEAGIGVGDSVSDVRQEVWTDYTVTYRDNGFSLAQKQKGVSNLTGYMEIDRILSQYINYAGMMVLV